MQGGDTAAGKVGKQPPALRLLPNKQKRCLRNPRLQGVCLALRYNRMTAGPAAHQVNRYAIIPPITVHTKDCTLIIAVH